MLLGAAAAVAVAWSLGAFRHGAAEADPSVYPWPIGAGPRYQPRAVSPKVAAGAPIGRLRCSAGSRSFVVHLELFANRKVVVVPPGIGVSGRACSYPVRTTAPTGVVHVDAAGRFRLGDLFAVWGRTLRPDRLLSFRGSVSAFVDGVRLTGDPRDVELNEHRQIVVEVGGYVPPHAHYLFPKENE